MMKTGFSIERMHTYLRGYYSAMGWDDALRALAFAREKHGGQYRKSGEPYLIHPLTIACHAAALGIRIEAVHVACLLHDVPEDCGVDPMDLPVQDQHAKDAVRLLTHQKGVPLDVYYAGIARDPIASLSKILDRCDNVSTMGGVFPDAKTLDYIKETEDYVMPLWRTTKDKWPEFGDALFVLKYHVLSVTASLAAVIPPHAGMPAGTPADPARQTGYTVCFLFSRDLKRVLLQEKAKTGFAGKLNGVGGRVVPGEDPETGALRKIQEETGICSVTQFRWIGTLSLPWNCDTGEEDGRLGDPPCVLHYFAGILPEGQEPVAPAGREAIAMHDVDEILATPLPDGDVLAGQGNLQYFVNQGLIALRQCWPPMKGEEH